MYSQKSEKVRLGARLRAARERAHISVQDAAQAAQVQPLAVMKWEKGSATPSVLQLLGLMEAYGCMAGDILFDENPWMLTPEQGAELSEAVRGVSASLRAKVNVYLAVHTQGVEPVWRTD